MKERLQKIIAAAGICSRRAAEELLRQGRVRVNGQSAALGDQADPESDIVTVDGQPLRRDTRRVYLMLNKPRGYVTTLSDERGRRTAADLAVRRLQRVREHTLTLGDLPVGQWRYLTQQELRDLEGSEKS